VKLRTGLPSIQTPRHYAGWDVDCSIPDSDRDGGVRGYAARRAFRLRDVTSTVIVLANVVVDLLYGVLDPRARG